MKGVNKNKKSTPVKKAGKKTGAAMRLAKSPKQQAKSPKSPAARQNFTGDKSDKKKKVRLNSSNFF